MARNQNTFAKMQRERDKKAKAEDKRKSREERRKFKPAVERPPLPDNNEPDPAD